MSANTGKVVFAGDVHVGKTALISRYLWNTLNTEPTIAVNTFPIDVELDGNRKVHMNVWDTAGGDDFRVIVPMYTREAVVAVLVFDVSCRATFANLEEWMKLVENECKVLIVANKSDLEADVRDTEIDEWCRKQKLEWYETSAKTGDGVDALFYAIAEEVGKRSQIVTHRPNVVLQPEMEVKESKACC